ncbi:MAG: response regulator [Cyanobacteria bacterium P01_D01_bin.56]
MAHAADREVWLNFLDEVDEYLNTIESVLLSLADKGVDSQQMDAALRAVHTIKGIGSMIECPSMTQLAHRFEDSLKIVKARRSKLQVDANLEILLLQGLDSLRQISSLHRQALPITESWLAELANPIFEKLRDRLGDIQPSDELALLADESDDDTAVVMFSTEVEELLGRLSSVLATPGLPCLREELEMMVEELQDLGRMLQLEPFISLCESIHQRLIAVAPHQVEMVAHQALELWQRSQALVMVGKLDKLPTQMELIPEPGTVLDEQHEQLDTLEVDTADENLADLFSPPEGVAAEIPNFDVFLGEPEPADTLTWETAVDNNLVFDTADNLDSVEVETADGLEFKLVDGSLDEIALDAEALEPLTVSEVDDDVQIDNGAVLDLEDEAEPVIHEAIEDDFETAAETIAVNLTGLETAIENFDPVDFHLEESANAIAADNFLAEEEDAAPVADGLPISDDNEASQTIGDANLTGLEAAIENFDPADFHLEEPTISKETVDQIVAEELPEEPSFAPPLSYASASVSSREPEPEEIVELHVEPVETTNKTQELQENTTVRVPIKLLNQLNDLFGELIIQRNTMNSRLDQMEDLINLFAQRMGSLENTNAELQTFCNQLSVDTSIPVAKANEQLVANGTSPSIMANAPAVTEQAFDSLELDRYSDLHLLSQDQRETLLQLREVSSDVKLNMREIKQASSNLNRTAKSLQINVTRARMRPLSDIVERFPRTVRELSLQHGKTVNLKISGGSTLIDRFVAVHLRDPLIHLLRNAFDHGIEATEVRQAQGKSSQGTIEIRAAHRGNQTLISVSDDGAGINLDKIRDRAYQLGLTDDILNTLSQSELLGMIFEPGFSTADQVTDLSGRGIGMDVVRNSLEQIRSEIKVDTQPGVGTTFTISVPFTLSIVRVLLVESGGMRIAFPTDSVEEMIRLNSVQVFDSPEQQVINWEGLTVPLINFDKWLEFRGPLRTTSTDTPPIISEPSILIVRRGDRLSGIYIDRFWGEREVVIRQVENVISLPSGFNGCTILEDGHVVPLADATKLLEWIDRGESQETIQNRQTHWQHLLHGTSDDDNEPPQPLALPQAQQINVMVVDDSINMRQLLRTTLEQAGYSVEQGKDGQDAVDQLFGGLSVDAIVCDIEMPRLDGYGVLAEIKADPKLKDLPIIMLTSRGSDKHRQLAMRLGATAYITKPYQDHELLQMLDQVIQQQPVTSVR